MNSGTNVYVAFVLVQPTSGVT